jgi:hypothetical protein
MKAMANRRQKTTGTMDKTAGESASPCLKITGLPDCGNGERTTLAHGDTDFCGRAFAGM